jgi:uncharacterized protein
MIGRIVLQLSIIGLLLVGGITMFQDRLLYFPEPLSLPAVMADAQRDGLRRWPAEGEFRGLLREPEGSVRATLVLFHGNAGHAGDRTIYAGLARHGVRVILAEYPGYGPRHDASGKTNAPSEAAFAADAAETIVLAQREFGAPVILAGESLGAGVAAAAYARVPQSVAALWLITPWDNLANVARHHYPWLPVEWMLRDRYDSLANLKNAPVPVAIVLAEHDSIVPARFGRQLYEQLSSPKRLWQISGAGHNDWPGRVDERWWADVANYLLQVQAEKGAPTGVSAPAG